MSEGVSYNDQIHDYQRFSAETLGVETPKAGCVAPSPDSVNPVGR